MIGTHESFKNPATAALAMGSNKITGLADGTDAQDAATFGQVGQRLPLAGGTMTGLLTLSGAPTSALHAATKGYVDSAISTANPVKTIAGANGITIPCSALPRRPMLPRHQRRQNSLSDCGVGECRVARQFTAVEPHAGNVLKHRNS